MLASADEVTIRGLVQSVAIGLLRHYPQDFDLDLSASALPGVWTHPTPERHEEKDECADVIPLFRTRTEE
ncbi:hypothetical protein [Caballeronia sp. EK]|uniref:hypothetical protein n=1 Tax=Caballeronia sp. EK TaxID=2767469 RepID=UPI002714E0BD|nr:hypothetical protein [Caballeronia sp. EK]